MVIEMYGCLQWYLNRQKDFKDGKYVHLASNHLEARLRDDLERLKKIRAHRGMCDSNWMYTSRYAVISWDAFATC